MTDGNTTMNQRALYASQKGLEPSEEFGVFDAARRLLWYLKDPRNIGSLPEDFRRESEVYSPRVPRGTKES
jgi:hypothetical protein